ncbi:uncharacterized protein DUF2637 [Pseudonocardia sediminis]|uniref:Uncharacterized protein DUF2637 n=1 Tax=Pseudonocardia sediminis TaxID=1397368 RepID=A0A4V6MDZ6_PSEST|nr:DUF2637 domain-containing protein [Pseudonocardia sediminis]RZT75452.1 uncharacterized protein DUF2637 [Pseudonocardia sediminis]
MSQPKQTTATPPPWRDGRAERIRAAAEAEQARAAAEATRAETAQRSERARAQLAAERSEQRAAEAARRRAAVRAGARAVVAELPSVAGFVACVAPTLIATRGQLEFARTQMQLGSMSVLLPAMLEGAAWLLAWRRHQAVAAGEPAGRLTAGVWLLAAVAASLNLWHGATGPGGLQVGVAYALASLVGFALVELLVGHQRRARAAAGRARRRRGLLIGLARLLRYPLLSWAAWSRRVELGPGADAAEAWGQAWRDRFGVELGADAIARRRGRTGVRAQRRAATAPSSTVQPDPDTDVTEPADTSTDVPGTSGDERVRELAELLRAECLVTGSQAAALYAVSPRTGRRLLSEARDLLAGDGDRGPEPPEGPDTGAAAEPARPLILVATPTRLEVGA